MTRTVQIGSGRALFILPGGKFINANKPLEASANSSTVKEVKIVPSRAV